ncbi:hypothetical protein AFLA_001332 [Aspergillus flavus NRRL3357]|nr:hypothetical protein AFLA_001332 [Aspergillus flavus NRRL3357]
MNEKSSSKNLKTKIQSFLHRSDRTSATGVSDTDLEITLIAKDRMDTGKGSGGGQALYNGDQCFGTCCRGSGYPR